MAADNINVLVSTFNGLGLPPTINLPLSRSTSVLEVHDRILERLPDIGTRYILSRLSTRTLHDGSQCLGDILDVASSDLVTLRLSVPLCGGKGGFGSQLRAAGGRMSSRKKKNQNEHGSSRNLDGRRLRTVTEAKALAEYLAIKPEMEAKEKEKRRERWQQIVDSTEQRQHEIKYGTKGKLDGQWVEDKDESNERTRDAVAAAMQSGAYHDNMLSSSVDSEPSRSGEKRRASSAEQGSSSTGTTPPEIPSPGDTKGKGRATFFGFDEDDEFMSSDDDEEEDTEKRA